MNKNVQIKIKFNFSRTVLSGGALITNEYQFIQLTEWKKSIAQFSQ